MGGVSSSNAAHSSLVHVMKASLMRCTVQVHTCVHVVLHAHKCTCHMNALIFSVERGKQEQEPNKLISQENAGLTSVFESTIAVRCHACGVTWLLLDKRYNALRMPHAATKVEL